MTTKVEETPTGVAQVITPVGLEVYYQNGPKRLYRIRWAKTRNGTPIPETDFNPWWEVPSVSTVLGVLDKPALVWWGMKVGIEGMLELFRKQGERFVEQMHDRPVDHFVDWLKSERLTVNHQRDRAADRGTNVHSALEAYAETGVIPDPQFYPENERGYVQGLVNFIQDAAPTIKHSELMVASTEGFAGRFDLVALIDGHLVTKTYPKREDGRQIVRESTWLLDLKTSKDVYPSYHLQLAAYHRAMLECGYDEVDHKGVVRVTEDGRYELVECKAIYQDFANALALYSSLQRIKEAK